MQCGLHSVWEGLQLILNRFDRKMYRFDRKSTELTTLGQEMKVHI